MLDHLVSLYLSVLLSFTCSSSLSLFLGLDQLMQERDQLAAKYGESDADPSVYDKRSSSMNLTQATNSQDDEGEEGEISESD